MRIEYIGKNEEKNYREGYIYYNGDNEQEKADYILNILREKGWHVEEEEECASICVNDKNEYMLLLSDYKEAKKVWKRK